MQPEYHVAIAGWGIRSEQAGLFEGDGSHLQRYASRFNAVEINSSFYRAHKRETYQRWAETVPPAFRFAVKMPKSLTHEGCLQDTGEGALSPVLGGGKDQDPARGRCLRRAEGGHWRVAATEGLYSSLLSTWRRRRTRGTK